MPDYITLLGSEDVSRAGHNIQAAADKITTAASSMDDTSHRISQAIEQFGFNVQQLSTAIDKLASVASDPSEKKEGAE